MTKNLLLLTVAVLSNLTFAGNNLPLLVKGRSAGFVPPQFANSFRCNVFADKRVMYKTVNGVSFSETKPITIDVTQVRKLIDGAYGAELQGNITDQVGPTDGPTLYYHGNTIAINDGNKEVKLKMQGDRIYSNNSTEAKTLILILDEICK